MKKKDAIADAATLRVDRDHWKQRAVDAEAVLLAIRVRRSDAARKGAATKREAAQKAKRRG